jgi:hypothetical protein
MFLTFPCHSRVRCFHLTTGRRTDKGLWGMTSPVRPLVQTDYSTSDTNIILYYRKRRVTKPTMLFMIQCVLRVLKSNVERFNIVYINQNCTFHNICLHANFVLVHEVWGSHGGEDVDVGLPDCNTVELEAGDIVSEEHYASIFRAKVMLESR